MRSKSLFAIRLAGFVALSATTLAGAQASTLHGRHRHLARVHHHVVAGWAPRLPRWDPVEVQAEVHTWYPNRTPYPYPGLFYPW